MGHDKKDKDSTGSPSVNQLNNKRIERLNEESQNFESGELKLAMSVNSMQRLPRTMMTSTQPQIFRRIMEIDDDEMWRKRE